MPVAQAAATDWMTHEQLLEIKQRYLDARKYIEWRPCGGNRLCGEIAECARDVPHLLNTIGALSDLMTMLLDACQERLPPEDAALVQSLQSKVAPMRELVEPLPVPLHY